MKTSQQRMTLYLKERGVDLKYAEEAGLRAIDASDAQKFKFPYALPGIVIPYLNPWKPNSTIELIRIRYFDPPLDKDGKEVKFAQPKQSSVEAYFDPHVDWAKVAKDTNISICFVEGEIKALAANQSGIVTIGLRGVDSFGGIELTPWLRRMKA
jgi:uncharacterized protein DUF3854